MTTTTSDLAITRPSTWCAMLYRYPLTRIFFFTATLLLTAQGLYSQHSVLVRLCPGAQIEDLLAQFHTRNTHTAYQTLRWKKIGRFTPIYEIVVEGGLDTTLLERLRSLPAVCRAQKNGSLELRRQPDDPMFDLQWGLRDIEAPRAWDLSTGIADTPVPLIAVIDAGFDWTHEDLQEAIYRNTAEIPDDSIDNDNNGYVDDYLGYNLTTANDKLYKHRHGTRVAGIIAARGNNGIGITGVNWNGQLLLVSLGKSNQIQDADLYAALEYVWHQRQLYNRTDGQVGAYVVGINFSLGRERARQDEFPLICAIIDSLGHEGVLTVASTANLDVDVDVEGDLPCACTSPYLICVTALNQSSQIIDNAAYGKKSIDIGAPGKSIWSTSYGSGSPYDAGTGTSYASPFVSGAIQLIYTVQCNDHIAHLKASPDSAARYVKDLILRNAEPIATLQNRLLSGGKLNLYRIFSHIKSQYCHDGPTQLEILQFYSPMPHQVYVLFNTPTYGRHFARIVDTRGRVLVHSDFYPLLKDVHSYTLSLPPLPKGVYYFILGNDYEIRSRAFAVLY